ncbi:MAG: vWA domain-containing protein [Ilumatobacter sp.]|uniref:vWA domain-containing protein n=1 Tax=Ilumatobacter sp. TaxID=1967498 RepID=UPI003C7853DF
MTTTFKRALSIGVAALVVVTSCGGGGGDEPLDRDAANSSLDDLVDDIGWIDDPVSRRASIPPPSGADLAATLPGIDTFDLSVDAPLAEDDATVEIFASTEKSGEGTDGWINEVAEAFNDAEMTLADGTRAGVEIRQIASGTGYQFIASGKYVPDAFSPSNQLWVEMAAEFQPMTEIDPSLVENTAGIVMKTETADDVRAAYGEATPETLVDAVIAGDLVMGYTDPFASSTGLNFLVTVLDAIAEGDESRITSPDVASVFEQFQRQVPFVALTTLQMRDSVESDTGTLDTFVMEYQTFIQTDSLQSGFEFIPFGVRHDNPLYAVGDIGPQKTEVLELFAEFAESDFADLGREYGFDPPDYTAGIDTPSGSTLIDAQAIWKDKKDGGRPVSTVFVVDVSGSMAGSRIQALQLAMLSAREFIKPETRVGIVEFDDRASLRLPIGEFDLNQQGRYTAVAEDLAPGGGTAMYDGVVLGLSMLQAEAAANPDVKPLLVVLTDGETTDGLDFDRVDNTIAGLRIPVYTVGFEANLDELGRLSSLVEAASINADQDDVEFKIAALFNAGG